MSLRVIVSREGPYWLADVPDVQGTHTYARSLAALDHEVREAVEVGLDLDHPYGGDLDWDYTQVSPRLAEAARIARARQDARRRLDQLTSKSTGLAIALRGEGLSVRDVAVVVDLTPGRISQITSGDRRARA